MKRTLLTLILVGLIGYAHSVEASGKHKPVPKTEITNIHNTFILEDCYVGGANAAADQIKQDWHTNATQWGIGMGHSCSETGLAFGISKKSGGILWTGSAAYDDINKEQIGIGINGRF